MRWRPVGPGRDGPAGCVLPAAPAVRQRRGARAVDADRRDDLLPCAATRRWSWRGARRASDASPKRARRSGELQFDCLGRRAGRHASAGTRCASRSRQHGLRNSLLIAIAPTATIASIAGCYECIEPQVSQPVQARDAVGRLPAGQPLPGRRTEEARPVDRRDPRRDQARRRLDPGHRRRFPTRCARSIARPGSCRCGR